MVKNTLVFGIILLFIISAVSLMVIGLESDADIDVEMEEFLDNLTYYCFDSSGGNEKYEYYKEQMLDDYSDNDIDLEEGILVQPVEPPQTIVSSGPMDSPWPMKCQNNRHTSRSPYSTTDNPYDEKWRFRSIWAGSIESSAIIDSNGIIYYGTMGSDNRLYALYPNGTKKWEYTDTWIIWSTPAIDENGIIYFNSILGMPDYLHAIYANNGTLKWRYTISGTRSSPAIADDGTIIFGDQDNFDIIALNPNGTLKWKYHTNGWASSSPAIADDGTIYIGSRDHYLYALYPNGTLQWRYRTGDWIKGAPSIAEDGTIYAPSFDGYLHAIYPNGTMKWKASTGSYIIGAGVAIGIDNTVYVGTDKLRAYHPDNGTIIWSVDVGGDVYSTSPAVSADGTIYVSAGKSLVAVNPNGTIRWNQKIADVHARSSPIIGEDGTVYVGSTWDSPQGWWSYFYAFGRGVVEADAHGPYFGMIDENIQFNGSASGGYPPYSWEWDFGDSNFSEEQNPTHMYTSPSNYTIILTTIDDSGNTSNDTTWARIKQFNDPPYLPEKPTGSTTGIKGISYSYSTSTSDSDSEDLIYYKWDWGDGIFSDWLGPYKSGEICTAKHKWETIGHYQVRVKAKDNYDDESDWSEPLDIGMSAIKYRFKNRILFLSAVIENIGDCDLHDIHWKLEIRVIGGTLRFPIKDITGSQELLKAHEAILIRTRVNGFALLSIYLAYSAEGIHYDKVVYGLVFGPFLLFIF